MNVEVFRGLSDEAFLRSAYVNLLGRAADSDGLKHLTGRLAQGATRQELWAELARSAEGQRHQSKQQPAPEPHRRASLSKVGDLLALEGSEFVSEAYWQILGRKPDAEGLQACAIRLASENSKEQILVDLRNSSEGRAFGSSLQGLDELMERVRSGAGVREPVTLDELLALTGKHFVKSAYRMLLNREVDPGGLSSYSASLLRGFSKLSVLDALASSDEGRKRAGTVPSLEARLRSYRKAKRPDWTGWYWRSVRGVESDLPRDRDIRAVLARLSAP